ncbi:MAG: hypothetical protein HY074_04005 [Deltaproteobacteria bacterium]|nr:hypothetical protein [Deltaproteobacteria bacterium]
MARKLIFAAVLLVLGVTAALVARHYGNTAALDSVAAGASALPPQSPDQNLPIKAAVTGTRSATAPKSVAPDQIAAVKHEWSAIRAKASSLADTDQAGFLQLEAQARAIIRSDEAALSKALAQTMPELVAARLEESFFTVRVWIRTAQHPTDILNTLMSYEPPRDPPSTDVHHVAQTPYVHYERIEAFGFKELRNQILNGGLKLDAATRERLVAQLVARATTEQSLDLALEMFQLLAALKEDALIRKALAGHSERDQQIIQSVLSAP